MDGENRALEDRLRCLLYGLLLEGTARYHRGILVTGANEKGSADVRHVLQLTARRQHHRAAQRAVTQSLVENALGSADGLAELFGGVLGHVEAPPVRPQAHGRLRRGFNVLLRAFEESYANNRLHQFVRAVEAVLLPARGRTKSQFAHRCGLFAGASAPVRQVLEQLYDLRSATEHLNDYEPILSDESDPEGVAFKRAYQAELLACGIYKRILHGRELRDHFATDDSTATFWRRPDDEIKRAWGEPLTIERT
jgi:hypothetical protein